MLVNAILLAATLALSPIQEIPKKPAEIPLVEAEKKDLDELLKEKAQLDIDIERISARQREFALKVQNLELKAKLRVKCDDCTLQANGTLQKPAPKTEEVPISSPK